MPKFSQKEDFSFKMEKVNTTIEFGIFSLVYNREQKIWKKLRKSCNYKQNINTLTQYAIKKLRYNCLQQLSTLRLTT